MVHKTASVASMFCYITLAVIALGSVCFAQVAYSRALPYSPRYIIRRVPVRRSADPAVGRVRLPITRYFPQVDTQIAPLPYQLPAVSYPVPADAVYAEDLMQSVPVERNDDEDYAYEYSDLNPVYADELYPQPQEIETGENNGDLYNDLMVNYLLQEMQPRVSNFDQAELLEIQRRNRMEGQEPNGNAPFVPNVMVANKRQGLSNSAGLVPSQVPQTPSISAAPSVQTSSVSPVASPSSSSASVVTAPPSQTLRKPILLASPVLQTSPKAATSNSGLQDGSWSALSSAQRGQKEYPFYRTGKSYRQNSPFFSLEEKLYKEKNNSQKGSFPLIEKLMSQQPARDPITEELEKLKMQTM